MLSLVLLFAAYMLVDGVIGDHQRRRAARQGERWGLLTFEGVVDILTGFVSFRLARVSRSSSSCR